MNQNRFNENMANIKSYTDLEQSKKLAEILLLDSADMEYMLEQWFDEKTHRYMEGFCEIPVVKVEDDCPLQAITIPCWSLAALLNVIPYASLEEYNGYWGCNSYNKEKHAHVFGKITDNSVDACYNMIIKLNELKLL